MLRISLFTLLLASLIWLAERTPVAGMIHPNKWLLLGFFFVLALTAHRIVNEGMRKNAGNIVVPYLTTVCVRLLLYVAFLAFFIYRHTSGIPILVTDFFILYLLYTGFEIYTLLSNLRRNSKNDANTRRYDSPLSQ